MGFLMRLRWLCGAMILVGSWACLPAVSPAALLTTLQNAAVATGNGTPLPVSNRGVVGISVTGTFSGTVTFEGSTDGQTTWNSVGCTAIDTGVASTTATAAGQFTCAVAGLTDFRARVSTWVSGSITVTGFPVSLAGGTAGSSGVAGSVTQSGTWTVQPGNTANTTAWKVDGSAVTQNIQGTTATDTAITQNPVMIACQGLSQGTAIGLTTSQNQRYITCNRTGGIHVAIGSANTFSCFVEAVTATTQCQALTASLRNYVTHISMSNEAATVQGLDIVYGTGTNCATGTTALTHKYQFGTNATTTSPFVVTLEFLTPLIPAAGNAICVRPTNATAFGATITGYLAQ